MEHHIVDKRTNRTGASRADTNKWTVVVNKRSQVRRKEHDLRNKLRRDGRDDTPSDSTDGTVSTHGSNGTNNANGANGTSSATNSTSNTSNANGAPNGNIANMKKMLCNNILTSGSCHYGDKCMYAHNLVEQNVDPLRKKAYDIIRGIEQIDYKPDRELGKALLQLTKVCDNCMKGRCPGAYNCKYGVYDKKYQVCADDLRYGICYNTSCNCVHLTNKGLVPLNSTTRVEPLRIIRYADKVDKADKTKDVTVPTGTLLTEEFLLTLNRRDRESRHESDSDKVSDDTEDIERVKAYLEHQSDTDDSCDESIFE